MCVKDVDVTKRGSHDSEQSCITYTRSFTILASPPRNIDIPNTHIHDRSLSWLPLLVTSTSLTHIYTIVHYPGFPWNVDVTKRGSQDNERSCICVLGMSMLLGGEARIVSDRVYVLRMSMLLGGEVRIVSDHS
jgi:hypothetical protein